MSRDYPLCDDIIVDEYYFQTLELFLLGYGLSPEEAQTIWETWSYRQHHMDLKTLERKMPKSLKPQESMERITKNLASPSRGFLEIYFKKDELCFRCTPLGFDVANKMTEKCYSNAMEKYYKLKVEFEELSKKIPYNPHRWFKGQIIKSRNNGREINIKIKNINRSEVVCGKEGDYILYDTIIEIEIYGCPNCKNRIHHEYSFNLDNLYGEPIDLTCFKCGHKFQLFRFLWRFR